MLEINLRQLEAFVATAEFHSFTKAAEAMYLTQSTVSSHINMLERALNVRLIQRGARQRVTLTEEGEWVYREAKNILRQCQALQDTGGQCWDNKLCLGACTVPGQGLLPELMADFLAQNPKSSYVLLSGDSMPLHRCLDQGKCRISFVDTIINHQSYHYHPVLEDRLVLIAPNTKEYQQLWQLGTPGEKLLDRPVILQEDAAALDRYLMSCGLTRDNLQIVAQIADSGVMHATVCRGLGLCITSMLTAQKDIDAGKLLAFALTGDTTRNIYMAWRRDCPLSNMEQKFIHFVQERYNTLSRSEKNVQYL
jgi:DNA-binding transcriptional LysR family regulator